LTHGAIRADLPLPRVVMSALVLAWGGDGMRSVYPEGAGSGGPLTARLTRRK
jgi:hypothetical protein